METPKDISFLPSFCARSPDHLIAIWRHQATQYDRDGVSVAAKLLSRVADELEAIAGDETVTLAEAAERSGYCADHLRRLAKGGRLVNVGRRHAPRFRARDLPIKGQRFPTSETSDIFPTQSNDETR